MAINIPICPDCGAAMERTASTRYICLSNTSSNSIHHVFTCPTCGQRLDTMEVLGYAGPIAPIGSIETVTYKLDETGRPVV